MSAGDTKVTPVLWMLQLLLSHSELRAARVTFDPLNSNNVSSNWIPGSRDLGWNPS